MKDAKQVFQIATIFIGTIVGAGLASGKEITEFFTTYGIRSVFGIIFTGIFYILLCSIISKLSIEHNLKSYSDVINLVSPNIFGKLTGIITTIYLMCSASIILAGSGAILNQFFGIPKIIGTLIMATIAILVLLRGTDGLVEINAIIVPSLIFVISTLTILYLFFSGENLNPLDILRAESNTSSGWVLSTILYAGYNVLCCTGVIVPISTKYGNQKTMIKGICIGAGILTFLCIAINMMLLVNQPHIYEYEIPLLYVADRFGKPIQIMLMGIILAEMFSTEVSDVYSIGQTLKQTFKIDFKKAVIGIVLLALPISLIGFSNLIETIYPIFGGLSLIFIFQCFRFFFKKHK
ncbi:transporter [uncultured Clostridium sp.]|uniref:YkvI family membrane protein n=1 Tax=uncultured Clostridium sp. TaxID=59620 RepID=UPI00260FBACC|nr:transporter [uncultured Clostridium sp.]